MKVFGSINKHFNHQKLSVQIAEYLQIEQQSGRKSWHGLPVSEMKRPWGSKATILSNEQHKDQGNRLAQLNITGRFVKLKPDQEAEASPDARHSVQENLDAPKGKTDGLHLNTHQIATIQNSSVKRIPVKLQKKI